MNAKPRHPSPHDPVGPAITTLPPSQRPAKTQESVEEEFLAPSISRQQRRVAYACGCYGSANSLAFLRGWNKRLLIRNLELEVQSGCGLDRHLGIYRGVPEYSAIVVREGTYLGMNEGGRPVQVPSGWYQITNPLKIAGPMKHSAGVRRLRLMILVYSPDLVGEIIERERGSPLDSNLHLDMSPRRLFPAARRALTTLEDALAALPAIGNTIVVESTALQFLGLLLAHHPNNLPSDERRRMAAGARDPRIKNAITFLLSRHAARISLKELSEVAGLSRSHLLALFKAEVGLPPHQYVIRYRLRKAADLFQTTTLSVKEVSALVGFDDPSHFGRLFRRAFGAAPSSLKHKLLKKAA